MPSRYPLLLLLSIFLGGTASAQPVFLEADGIVRVDLESTTNSIGQWVVRDELSGFIGERYLEFEGPNFFNDPGNSLLSYTVRIATTGTYLFRWHSRITEPDENTDFNDSWLRCPDASLFFAERNGSIVYPRGSGRTPNPEGSSSNNWFKAYQNRRNEWFWGVFTSDNDPHDIYVRFDEPGDYTIQISGRSTGHAIDRFVLVHASASVSEAQRLTAPESERATTSLTNVDTVPLQLFPNPATDYVAFRLPTGDAPATYRLTIHAASGRVVRATTHDLLPGATLRVPLADIPAGSYLLSLEAGGKLYQGQFTK